MVSRALKTSAGAIILSSGMAMAAAAPASAFDYKDLKFNGCFPTGSGHYTCLDFSGKERKINTWQYRKLLSNQSGQSGIKNNTKKSWKNTLSKYAKKYMK